MVSNKLKLRKTVGIKCSGDSNLIFFLISRQHSNEYIDDHIYEHSISNCVHYNLVLISAIGPNTYFVNGFPTNIFLIN